MINVPNVMSPMPINVLTVQETLKINTSTQPAKIVFHVKMEKTTVQPVLLIN